MELEGSVAIVTGAGRGIGREVAREFGRNGASVVVCSRTEEDIWQTASLIQQEGGNCLPVRADVSEKEQVIHLVEETLNRFGRIDVLFNNAARIPVISALWEVDPDDWWEEVTVNLRGTMLCARYVLPHMMAQDRGVIINMAGGTGIPGRTSYCCSKVAVDRLTTLLARELQAVNSSVIVFQMGPGLVKTRRTLVEAESEQGQRWNPATRQAFEEGKDRPPAECARAAVLLLRRASAGMSGKYFSAQEVLASAQDS